MDKPKEDKKQLKSPTTVKKSPTTVKKSPTTEKKSPTTGKKPPTTEKKAKRDENFPFMKKKEKKVEAKPPGFAHKFNELADKDEEYTLDKTPKPSMRTMINKCAEYLAEEKKEAATAATGATAATASKAAATAKDDVLPSTSTQKK